MQNNKLKKNLKNFDFIINKFFKDDLLTIRNYYPEFKKFHKKLKKNFKYLKLILENIKKEQNVSLDIQNLVKILVKEGEDYSTDYKYLKKKNHYNNILEYLEIEKNSPSPENFKKLYEDFFQCLEDHVAGFFYMKEKLKNYYAEEEDE